MKVKAILKGNKLTISRNVVLKKPEVEVEVDIRDEDIQLYTEEEQYKTFDEYKDSLIELIDKTWGSRETLISSKDYKEIFGEILAERYKERRTF